MTYKTNAGCVVTVQSTVIIGAGRQGRNVLEILLSNGEAAVSGFLDDTMEPGSNVHGVPVLGGLRKLEDSSFVRSHSWIIAIGNIPARAALFERLKKYDAQFVNAVHPLAWVSEHATVGSGVYVAAFARLYSDCQVGDCAIIEGGVSVGVDTKVGRGCLIGPGAHFLGGSSLGERSLLGAGAVICNDIAVGAECSIGANSVVARPLADGSRAFGAPAQAVASP